MGAGERRRSSDTPRLPSRTDPPAASTFDERGRHFAIVSGMSAESRTPDITIRELQELIRKRYHATDSARGIPGTFMWLIEEVGELATALHENAPDQSPTPEQQANLAEEFADVLAWLATLANVAEVDLAQALTKYTDPDRVKGVKS